MKILKKNLLKRSVERLIFGVSFGIKEILRWELLTFFRGIYENIVYGLLFAFIKGIVSFGLSNCSVYLTEFCVFVF